MYVREVLIQYRVIVQPTDDSSIVRRLLLCRSEEKRSVRKDAGTQCLPDRP